VRQKDLKIAKLTKGNEKERVDTEAYEYYTTEDEEPDESLDKKQNESIDEKPRESDDDYHDYTSSGDDKAPTSRAHWTPQQEDPKREIREAREDYGRKQMKKRKEKDEKDLITRWHENQKLFEGKWKVKPGCIHFPHEGGSIKRFNMCTKKYEEPEKVEQFHDARTGRTTRIDICYVVTYESNRPRRRAASETDSCDYKTQDIALSVLPVTKEPERKTSNPKQRKAKTNIFLRMYLITIGAILLAERPQVNLENLNQSLVKANRLVYGGRSNPADIRIMR